MITKAVSTQKDPSAKLSVVV